MKKQIKISLINVILSSIFISFINFIPCYAKHFEYQFGCGIGKECSLTKKFMGNTIELKSNKDFPEAGHCEIKIVDKNKNKIFEHSAEAVDVFFCKEKRLCDVQSAALIQVMHTTPLKDSEVQIVRKLFVFTLAENPKLLKEIKNEYGFWLQDDSDDGKLRIWTCDGVFYNDKELKDVYHYDLLVPLVVFEIDGDELIDATSKSKVYFDKEIENFKSKLKPKTISNFKAGLIKDEFDRNVTKGYILGIALTYLYSGREEEAKQTLDDMWPSNDEARIWKWMLERHSKGILAQIDGNNLNKNDN